jgi:hypothetical protein
MYSTTDVLNAIFKDSESEIHALRSDSEEVSKSVEDDD